MYRSQFRGDLSAELDRLQRQMQAAHDLSSPGIRGFSAGFPALNIGRTADATEVYVFAPGVDPAKVEVTLDCGVLTIAGERAPADAAPADGSALAAAAAATFTSTSALPAVSAASSACPTTSTRRRWPPTTATACCTSASSGSRRRSRAASTCSDAPTNATTGEHDEQHCNSTRRRAGRRKPQEQRDERTLLPNVDVFEDAGGITLLADLPGASKDRLEPRVEGGTLTIEGRLAMPAPQAMEASHAEVQLARYHRAFVLSNELDAGKITAYLTAGVLRLRIPKAEHAQPRRIEVRAG